MKTPSLMQSLRDDMARELYEHILPYWMNKAVDHENGGFYGRIDGGDTTVPDAPKGGILYTRILWTFAAAYRMSGDTAYRSMAARAYEYIEKHFWDPENGGLYWMVDHSGRPVDLRKHTYVQAFGIYAYSEYFRATNHKPALDRACEIYALLDERCFDARTNGYYEAFSAEWTPLEDVRLSDKDLDAVRSMNTHIHLIEAFTNLYRCRQDASIADRLRRLVSLFQAPPVYDTINRHYLAFFDESWKPASAEYSYGHDIEAGWLLCDAARALGDDELLEKTRIQMTEIARQTLSEGIDHRNGGVYNFGAGGTVTDMNKQWWVQAEAIVGFLEAYAIDGAVDFLTAAHSVWLYVKENFIDRENGEWYFLLSREGVPYMHEDKAGLWKCPYHSSRACLEVQSRTETLLPSMGHGVGDIR
jgi:cellobiose epimerase